MDMATILKDSISPDDHIQGDPNAPVTMVEYGDYECPYCGEAHYIIKAVQERFGRQLRFVFRNFPLTEIHPHAQSAAETAEFAGANGRFWEMHDALYENQDRLGLPLYLELAGELGLSGDELRRSLAKHEFLPKIRADFMGGVRSGVNGTPTFFINQIRHDGPYDYESLVSAIEMRLMQAKGAA
jgi:protein-disulfide isomerase